MPNSSPTAAAERAEVPLLGVLLLAGVRLDEVLDEFLGQRHQIAARVDDFVLAEL